MRLNAFDEEGEKYRIHNCRQQVCYWYCLVSCIYAHAGSAQGEYASYTASHRCRGGRQWEQHSSAAVLQVHWAAVRLLWQPAVHAALNKDESPADHMAADRHSPAGPVAGLRKTVSRRVERSERLDNVTVTIPHIRGGGITDRGGASLDW